MTDAPWPTDLAFSNATKSLRVAFDDGETFDIPFELLRVESPSAEVQGHGAGEKKLVAGKRRVGVTAAEEVGTYAVRIVFDDAHATGIYTWERLRTLGREKDARMADYARRLAAAGLSRD